MTFVSYNFILFLIVTAVLYYTCFRRLQWQLLLAASIVFYAFSGLTNLIYIGVTVVSVYIAGRVLEAVPKKKENARKRRLVMLSCLILNLGILVVVRYSGFFVPSVSIIWPLAISFYTFQSLGYLFDVYRGKAAEKCFFRYALFAMFFPQMVVGPISRYGDLGASLYSRKTFDGFGFSEGVNRIFWGFFKKIVVADRLIPVIRELTGANITGFGGLGAGSAEAVTGSEPAYMGVYVLFTVFLYAITIYSDFTGSIDITIGVARALGVSVKENFDMPFYSRNIAEYWRRWHITMGTWFKDYLFYPMTTSKTVLRFMKFTRRIFGEHAGRRIPVYLCTLVLWFLTGFWHGATWNFIAWGLANGVVIIISQELAPLKSFLTAKAAKNAKSAKIINVLAIFGTFWLMNFIRAFDIYPGVGNTFRSLGSIVTNPNIGGFKLTPLGLDVFDYVVIALCCLTMILTGIFSRRNAAAGRKVQPFTRYAACAALGFAILIFGAYGFGYDVTLFIYNQF